MPINLQPWRQRQYMIRLFMTYSACVPILFLLYAAHSMVINNITLKINQLIHDKQVLNHQIAAIRSTHNNHHCDTYLLLQQIRPFATKKIYLQKKIRQLLMHLPSLTPVGCQINQLAINNNQIEWQLYARHIEDITLYCHRMKSLSFINDITVSTLQQSPNGLGQYHATIIGKLSTAQE